MDDERQCLLDTSYENTQSVVQSLLRCSSVEQLLNRYEYIRIRSSNLTLEEQAVFLNVTNDLDGVVLGLHSLLGIQFQVRYVNFLPHGIQSLKRMFPLLKKHLPLYDHNNHLPCLRAARGIQLFYEHGWDCSIALLPSKNEKIATAPNNVCNLTYEYFQQLVCLWRKSLSRLLLEGQCVPTLMKNTISSSQKLHILPDDQEIIFQTLSDCIDVCDRPQSFEPFVFVYRFGERSSVALNIENEFNFQFIRDQSLHVAASISTNSDIGFLWSRNGLERVIGERGTLTSCLSFSEAANFQSNLDGRLLDVSRDVLKIANFQGKIGFVQFYGDTPHVYPEGRMHPVSGSIVNCGLLHGNALTALERDAHRYINVCRENVLSFVKEPTCRLEFVLFPERFIPKPNPNKLINIEKVSQLLMKESIVVPFDNQFGLFTDFLKVIGGHLVEKLQNNFENEKRLGKYVATWESFQYELAIEKLLWGRPLSFYHPILSVNLGPGLGHPTRSKTDWLGFLALDETGSGLSDSAPPLSVWFNNAKITSEVESLFTLNDYLNASNSVLGRKVVIIIIQDLFFTSGFGNKCRFNNLLLSLKSGELPEGFVCGGSINLTELARFLSEGKCVKGRLSTKRMREMLEEERPYVDLLVAGMRDLTLFFFPAVRKYDSSRNNALHWDGIRLLSVSDTAYDQGISDWNCQSITQTIIRELNNKKLMYESKLLRLQNTVWFQFPWIKATLLKLADSTLTSSDKLKILVFVSSVAFMQQGWYICFNELKKLERDLPISQFNLKGREILSTKLLGCVTCMKVFRVHPSISVKIALSERNVTHTVLPNQNDEIKYVTANIEYGNVDSLRDTVDCIPSTEEVVVRQEHAPRHVSVGCRRKWAGEELEIVNRVSACNARNAHDKYKNYLKICLKEGVPDRPFESFKRKLYRV